MGKQRVKLGRVAAEEEKYGMLFAIAPFIGFCIFSAFPIIFAFIASFSNWRGTNSIFEKMSFDNYIQIVTDPKFWQTVVTTLIYMIGIPVGLILSLIIAVAMNKKIPGVKILRTMYYVPVVSSLVAVAILWAWVFNYDYGLFNVIIKKLTGLKGPNWLGDEGWVKVAMLIFMVWKGLGTSIVLYLAALQNIPKDYYEAATIDGANGWKQFLNITIPLVSPVTFYMVVTGIIGGFQVFVEVQVMTTNGGTNYSAATIVYYLYDKAFKYQQMGYGSAVAFILAIFIFIVTYFNFKGQDKWVKTMD